MSSVPTTIREGHRMAPPDCMKSLRTDLLGIQAQFFTFNLSSQAKITVNKQTISQAKLTQEHRDLG